MARILMVEPSADERSRTSAMLREAGYSVIERTSLMEAMGELVQGETGYVDLILTELNVGAESGLTFIRWLKEQEKLKGIQVIVMTEEAPRETVIEVVKAGAATIISKPFGGELLRRRIAGTLNERATAQHSETESVSWRITDFLRREVKRAQRNGASLTTLICRVTAPLDSRAVSHLIGGFVHELRESDVIARWGEGHIIIILPDTDAKGAAVVQARLREVSHSLPADPAAETGKSIQIVSGVATFPMDAIDGEALIALARDRCAYAANAARKSKGK